MSTNPSPAVPNKVISVIKKTYQQSDYRDQRYSGSTTELEDKLKTSTTLYVGNLSFYTSEEQMYELFSKVGEVKRIIMGLDRFKKTPCGFCFVEYYTRRDAEDCIKYLSQTKLDDRIIRCDWDAGFQEGRQYGRGKSGGQVRDEYRSDYDSGRGGYGKGRSLEFEAEPRYTGGSQMYHALPPMMPPMMGGGPPPMGGPMKRDRDDDDERDYRENRPYKSGRYDRHGGYGGRDKYGRDRRDY